MSDSDNKRPDNHDWLQALSDLESYDARRERRRAVEKRLTPLPVIARRGTGQTPLPVPEEEGAVRVPAEARDKDAEEKRSAAPARPDMARYEALCKKPSIALKGGDIRVIDEMSEILCSVNVASALIGKFVQKHPQAVAEDRIARWENTLRDIATVMYREFHALRNGRTKKTYDKRYVCSTCHSVFMAPLPGGMCDECRSRAAARPIFE
jgi:hypothetical protein